MQHSFVAAILNPLDSPHHMRADEQTKYRDGVIMDLKIKEGGNSYANCGLTKNVQIDKRLVPGTRVTVQMDYDSESE